MSPSITQVGIVICCICRMLVLVNTGMGPCIEVILGKIW